RGGWGGQVQPFLLARGRGNHGTGPDRGSDRLAPPGARPPGRRAAAAGRHARLARGARRRMPVGTVRAAPAAIADHRLLRAPDDQHPDRPAAGHLPRARGGPARLGRIRLVPGETMTWHWVTIAGYLLVVAGVVGLQLLAAKTPAPGPPFGGPLAPALPPTPRRGGGPGAGARVGPPLLGREPPPLRAALAAS